MGELENITSANAAVILTVEEIIPAGVQLQHFSTDQSFGQTDITIAEDRMGVDGHLAAGWIPSIKPVTISLEANSPSLPYLEMVLRAMETNKRTYECTLVATLPSVREIFTWTKGILKSGTLTSGKKVLDPTSWLFDFANIIFTRF